jgi:hypothetical protein
MNPAAGSPPRNVSRHRRVFLPVLAAPITLAWMALWAWARIPYGRCLLLVLNAPLGFALLAWAVLVMAMHA